MKIAFFDIDGTLTSEIDGSVPFSAIEAIRKARSLGHKMFINTGRCFQNVEPRFREVGWDGYVCGCGTDIYIDGKNVFYQPQTHEVMVRMLYKARELGMDIVFESKKEVAFDLESPLHHPAAIKQYEKFVSRNYQMPTDLENPNFFADKFCIWYQRSEDMDEFLKVSNPYFQYIDRGGNFAEFVPHGFSKATGITKVLEHYEINLSEAYVFGDSNNDIPMLEAVPHSVAMGNTSPEELKKMVSFVTKKASEDGIAYALESLGFFKE